MDQLNPPQQLSLTGNLAETFKRFKQAFEIYSTASGLEAKSKKIQSSTLLHIIGPEAIDIYNTFQWEHGDCSPDCDAATSFHAVSCILKQFENYCIPRKNVTIERHIFFTRDQQPGEQLDTFVTDLKLKSKSCEFGTLTDSLIKDRIVGGIRSDLVRARLLREPDLSLKKAQDICRAAEATEMQLKLMSEETNALNALSKHGQKPKPDNQQVVINDCRYCGKQHPPRRCPAFGQICRNCRKKNHFSSVCKSMPIDFIDSDRSKAHSNTDEFFLGKIDGKSETCREWTADLEVEGHQIKFTLDTGAQVNVLPSGLFNKLKKRPLKQSKARLTTYSGEKLAVLGKALLSCVIKERNISIEFQIVDTQSKPILGLNSCESLGLVQRIDVIDDEVLAEYPDVLEGLGSMKEDYMIRADQSVRPVVHATRKVPAALRDRLKRELDRMEGETVIEKVDHPTAWVNSLVIVEKKDGGLRLCLDPRDLNKAIQREHYQLPTIEEIASRQSGNRVFSVLDANSAFWQIHLNKKCADLTTFNTPFGRYRFLRLPFGLNSSAEVFAKRFHQAFEKVPGVETYMDELLIGGKDVNEHDERLRQVLETAREEGIKLKPSKCSIRKKEVKFVGHVITDSGLKADDSKIEAINAIPSPTNRKELERFLGMVNYLGKFLPNLSDTTAPLRSLLKKETEWQWIDQHEQTIIKLKKMITEAPVLAFYDPQKPITLSVDASPDGLGAALCQEDKPVAFMSRSLTDCEQRYAQIEKEMLAVVFGLEHFHYYVYGKSVKVETDHKPLEAIIKKPLSSAPPRLQRMLLRLMKYDVTLVYKPGKDMFVPDTLSRAALPQQSPSSDDWDMQVHMVITSLPMSDEKLEMFQKATKEDETLQTLQMQIQTGWPKNKADVPVCIRAFSGFHEEISVADGLLLKGEQLIVPASLQKDMLHKLHEGHLGRDKCLATAREIFFWPGMSSQIIDIVAKCGICNQFRHSQQKEPLINHDVPTLPWEKLGMDLFHFNGKNFLLMVDYYSKYIEVSLLSSLRATDVIMQIKSQFARHGIAREVISDNGPQFNCAEFVSFSKSWGFKHITSSPHRPQSNGMAERAVQTVKTLLTKAAADGKDPYIALMQYRNTPFPDSPSPAQLLMNRRLRTTLPATDAYLKPRISDPEVMMEAVDKRHSKQKKHYDKTALSSSRPPLKPGTSIRMQTERGGSWKPATVVSSAGAPRSYFVKTAGGSTFRRNRNMLRDTKETFRDNFPVEDQDENAEQIAEERQNPAVPGHAPVPYTTRYGRQVRTPVRYPDQERG